MVRKTSQTLILRDAKWKVEILDGLINKGYFLSRGEAYRIGTSIVLLSYGYLKHEDAKALCQQILSDMLKSAFETLDNKDASKLIMKLNRIHDRIRILSKIADLNPIIHEMEIPKLGDEILRIAESLEALREERKFNAMLVNIKEKLLRIAEKYNL